MPWSDSHSYVYVAIPKTGSTSMVQVLVRMHREEGGQLLLDRERIDAAFRERYRFDEIGDPQPNHAKHLSALQLKYVLGKRFDACFRFTLVRNPWARIVSRYRYNHIGNRPKDTAGRPVIRRFHDLEFPDWVRGRYARWSTHPHRYRSQLSKIVGADGKVLVDYVGRLEMFQASLDYITDRLGVTRRPTRHANATDRRRHFAQYYDAESREMVRRMCAEDIDFFGYTFEPEIVRSSGNGDGTTDGNGRARMGLSDSY